VRKIISPQKKPSTGSAESGHLYGANVQGAIVNDRFEFYDCVLKMSISKKCLLFATGNAEEKIHLLGLQSALRHRRLVAAEMVEYKKV
jgi:hypothetical protein